MRTKYEDDLEAGTKRLIEYISTPEVDEGERELIVMAFSKLLTENICDTVEIENGDELICRTSLEYNDRKVSRVLARNSIFYKDYENAVKRCSRMREILQLFNEKNWSAPAMINSDLEKTQEKLKSRIGNIWLDMMRSADQLIRRMM